MRQCARAWWGERRGAGRHIGACWPSGQRTTCPCRATLSPCQLWSPRVTPAHCLYGCTADCSAAAPARATVTGDRGPVQTEDDGRATVAASAQPKQGKTERRCWNPRDCAQFLLYFMWHANILHVRGNNKLITQPARNLRMHQHLLSKSF
jgi:hypothetical protein